MTKHLENMILSTEPWESPGLAHTWPLDWRKRKGVFLLSYFASPSPSPQHRLHPLCVTTSSGSHLAPCPRPWPPSMPPSLQGEQRQEQRGHQARLRMPVWMGYSTYQPGDPTGPRWQKRRVRGNCRPAGAGPGFHCGMQHKYSQDPLPLPLPLPPVVPLLKITLGCSFKDRIPSTNGCLGISAYYLSAQVGSSLVRNQSKTLIDLVACFKDSITLRGPSVHFARESLKPFALRGLPLEMCTQNLIQFELLGIGTYKT